jgi:hypothetical protein
MIKIAFDLDLDLDFSVANPTIGQDVTSILDNDVRPVKAIVIDPCGPGGGMPVVEVTFLDEDHAWEWMDAEGMDVDDMELHLGSHTQVA